MKLSLAPMPDMLPALARRRLEFRPSDEADETKKLRAEGWCVLGTPSSGYVLLPPERD
jgi:hypothetical protein